MTTATSSKNSSKLSNRAKLRQK